jgi:hypothetical protein
VGLPRGAYACVGYGGDRRHQVHRRALVVLAGSLLAPEVLALPEGGLDLALEVRRHRSHAVGNSAGIDLKFGIYES